MSTQVYQPRYSNEQILLIFKLLALKTNYLNKWISLIFGNEDTTVPQKTALASFKHDDYEIVVRFEHDFEVDIYFDKYYSITLWSKQYCVNTISDEYVDKSFDKIKLYVTTEETP